MSRTKSTGAEGDAVFRARVAAVIDSLAAQHGGETIAIVCHGGVIASYLANVFDMHRSLWLSVENTSISQIRLSPHGPMVVVANDCHHLYDPVLGAPG